MRQCPNGHKDYDERFYRSCPDCPKVDSVPKSPPPRQTQESASAPPPPQKPSAKRTSLEPTRLFWDSAPAGQQAPGAPREELEPVAGWLVAVTGPRRGKAFALRFGRNSVGREPSAIVFLDDPAASQEVSFYLTYDFRMNVYLIEKARDARGLIHLDRHARYVFNPFDGIQILDSDGTPLDTEIRVSTSSKPTWGQVRLETRETELTHEWNWYIHIGSSMLKFVPFWDSLTTWNG